MSYFLWGCRGILTLVTLRSERVNVIHLNFMSPCKPQQLSFVLLVLFCELGAVGVWYLSFQQELWFSNTSHLISWFGYCFPDLHNCSRVPQQRQCCCNAPNKHWWRWRHGQSGRSSQCRHLTQHPHSIHSWQDLCESMHFCLQSKHSDWPIPYLENLLEGMKNPNPYLSC